MPVYHSGNLKNTDRPQYNYPLRPATGDRTLPIAPQNLLVTSPYSNQSFDVRWDDPKIIPQNSGLDIIGCNVYRATDAQFGPYVKINSAPVGVLFYRDETLEQQITEEDATPTLKEPDEPDGRWLVYAMSKPIVTPGHNGKIATLSEDVTLEIDDGDGIFKVVPAFSVNGRTGEIALISWPTFDPILQQIIPPRLPHKPDGKVRISYKYLAHQVLLELNQRIFYKVTTVAVDPNDASKIIETPLDEVSDRSAFDIEEIDYIWREAILRNRYILEQGGERVKLFVRKWMGEKCESYEYTYGQSHHDCPICFGSNIKGGFEGPIDIIIAPPETERSVELGNMGLHVRYDWLSWMTNWPLLNERDVVVRQNNERYLVGAVNYQGQRGAIFQQHFNLAMIDHGDVRYKLSITGGETQVPESTDLYREEPLKTPASPVINAKPEIPEERIIRGRTVTFENISYVFIFGLFMCASVKEFLLNLVC